MRQSEGLQESKMFRGMQSDPLKFLHFCYLLPSELIRGQFLHFQLWGCVSNLGTEGRIGILLVYNPPCCLTKVILGVVLKILRLVVLEDFNIHAKGVLGAAQDFMATMTLIWIKSGPILVYTWSDILFWVGWTWRKQITICSGLDLQRFWKGEKSI